MQASKLTIGEHYRHKTSPTYAWAKVTEILKPMQGVNTNRYIVARCEWSVEKNDTIAVIKYFKPSDLVKG